MKIQPLPKNDPNVEFSRLIKRLADVAAKKCNMILTPREVFLLNMYFEDKA